METTGKESIIVATQEKILHALRKTQGDHGIDCSIFRKKTTALQHMLNKCPHTFMYEVTNDKSDDMDFIRLVKELSPRTVMIALVPEQYGSKRSDMLRRGGVEQIVSLTADNTESQIRSLFST